MENILREILNSNYEIKINNFFDTKSTFSNWQIAHREIDDNMLVFQMSGEGYYTINNNIYSIKPSRVVFVSSGTFHSAIRTDSSVKFDLYCFRFSLLNNGKEVLNNASFVYDFITETPFNMMFEKFYRYFEVNRFNSPENCINFFKAIINAMFFQVELEKNLYYDHTITKIGFEIIDSIKRKELISVEKIINEYKLSYYEFSKRFKLIFGMTFKTYVLTQKMNYANTLLHNSNLRVGEIAEILGYSDMYIFSNLYKKTYGVSPRQAKR